MASAEGKKKMLATLVGCNYASTKFKLQGCINDVHAMHAVLLNRFGFAPEDITMLTDDHKSDTGELPTAATVKRVLAAMVERAAPGDVLFFHFSGHGTEDSPGSAKEAIVASDLNVITDVDFGDLLHRVPQGATFTMVSDSCFSGGLFDEEKEQVGPGENTAGDPDLRQADDAVRTSRFIPYAELVAHLSGMSGMDESHHIGDHLVALFGVDASTKFHSHGHSSNTGGDSGILLSGSQKDETSADVRPHDGKPAYGAFTYALQTVLKAPMSNREVVRRAREVLGEQGFKQHPCLYCSDANADAPFLGQQETSANSK